MKSISALILLLSLFLFSCGGGSDQDNVDGNPEGGQEIPQDNTLLIKDANLTEAIRKALNKPEGELTKQDLESLESLKASGSRLSDLTPLKEMTKLEYLYLDNNKISVLEPLNGLSALKELHLKGNPITIDQLESLQKALPKCVIRFSEIITRLGNGQVDVTNEKKKTLYQMGENQLRNASFENDRQDWGLTKYGRTSKSTFIAIDDKEFKDGQKSYKLEIKEHEDSGVMKGYQAIVKQRSIAVNPGSRYLFSGYIKTQDLVLFEKDRRGPGRAYIGGYHGYSGAKLTATSHDWKYVHSLKVIDNNQTSFSFGIGFTNSNVTGTAWFDNLSLNLLTVLKHSVRVSAKVERGVPTGIMVKTGEKYRFDASGKWAWGIAGRGEASDANGTLGRPHKKELPVVVEGGLFGQLAGLVEDQKFLIGMANEITMEADGELLLLMNDRAGSYGDNSGSMNVTIKQVIP